MADIITALWLSVLLYIESRATADSTNVVPHNADLWYTTVFTAFGFVVGSVGSVLLPEFTYVRMLWPERYYHTRSPWKLAFLAFTMSAMGPLQSAGKRTLDGFRDNLLFQGAQEGDMLGTAFFEDTGKKYTSWRKQDNRLVSESGRKARNNFWEAVIALIPTQRNTAPSKDEESLPRDLGGFATRRIFHLELGYDKAKPGGDRTDAIEKIQINADHYTMLLGIFSSEASAIVTFCIVAGVYRSPYALCWLGPTLFKVLAVYYRLCRTQLVVKTDLKDAPTEDLEDPHLFELEEYKHGLFLVRAPGALGVQFFRHFGHPQRNQLANDRRREWVSIGLVIATMVYFPLSWVALALAHSKVRITWIFYQLFVLVANLVPLYGDFLRVGSLEEMVAEALSEGKTVLLGDDKSGYMQANLAVIKTTRIAEAQKIVESMKLEVLGLNENNPRKRGGYNRWSGPPSTAESRPPSGADSHPPSVTVVIVGRPPSTAEGDPPSIVEYRSPSTAEGCPPPTAETRSPLIKDAALDLRGERIIAET